MKNMKKTLVTLVAAVTAATNLFALASCGGEKVNYNQEVNVVAYDGSEVTVTFHHTMGAKLKDELNTALEAFNEIYPNITVDHSSPTNDYDELRTLISTGLTQSNSPSVAFCYPDHVALYNTMNAVAPLNGFIDSDLTFTLENGATETMGLSDAQKSDYVQAFYDEGKCYGDDTMYTLPYLKSTEVLYYNKTYFAENNLTVPTTWDEMAEVCEQIITIEKAKLKEGEKLKVTPLGYDSEANWFITMTEQLGSDYTSTTGEKYIFNTEENREFVLRFREWFEKGYFTTKALNGNTYTSDLFNQTSAAQPKCYMCIGSTGGSSYQAPTTTTSGEDPFEVGVAMIPQEDLSNPKVIQQGPSVCIFKKNNPQEMAASWLLIKYLTTSVEYQGASSMANGYTPVIKSVLDNTQYKAWLENAVGSTKNADLQAKTVNQALTQVDYSYISLAFNGSSAAREYVGALMQTCIGGDLKGKTAAEFIASEFEDTIKTLKYKFSD